ncbi:YaiO family outer membrane beta-barrel protein [Flavobacterium antarcticum]|uniref:YaiO family outer membrane beta-barrel protein n=1 Tax=Flavobacterium antarcticum TaxID=271155 RepID=UPI00042A3C6D|nr:YaiO family outer membrane beta-barrel protein [Flavobacterium antarcticum]
MFTKNSILKNTVVVAFVLLLSFIATDKMYGQATEDSYFKRANKLFKQERWEEAKQIVDIGLKDTPYDADLLMLNGKYYHYKRNNDKARYNLIKSLQYDPNNVDAKQILTNVEIEDKHYSAAICYINELLEVNPYWKGLWRKKIEVYRLQGNTEEATRLSKRINQIYPEDEKIQEDYRYNLKTEISSLKKSGKLEEALKLTNDLMLVDKTNPDLYVDVINTHLAAGDYDKALVYANRALTFMPNNSYLITKKASILADRGDYNEALSFIKSKNKGGNGQLTTLYNQLLLQNARVQNDSDPYTLYGKILERSPGNPEALNYLLNTSLSKGFYSDAQNYINMAKKSGGETKSILSKEYTLYTQMGNESKANAILAKLYTRFPEDADIRDNYINYQYKLARENMLNEQYREALIQLSFLNNLPKNDYSEKSMQELTQAYLKLGRKEEAFATVQKLNSEYPNSIDNQLRKVGVLIAMDRDDEALTIYEEFMKNASQSEFQNHLIAYDEIGTQFLKKLIEAGQTQKVFEVADRIIALNPDSELAYTYAMNTAASINDDRLFLKYAEQAIEANPDSILFRTKYAEALSTKGEFGTANNVLKQLLAENQYNKDVINTNTQFTLDYGKVLYKEKDADQLMLITDEALKYNPNNKELLYQKGQAHLLLKEYGEAFDYMKFYTPSTLEAAAFNKEMEWLQNKSYRNQVTLNYLRSRFADEINVNSIATLEYTRFQSAKNTYTARINYTGRDLGSGVLAQAEWSHVLNQKTYFIANVGYGSRYFAQIIANGSVFRNFASDYELELGLGYRNLPDVYTLTNIVAGVSHTSDHMWLNAKGFIYKTDTSLTLYNVLAQSKFYIFNDGKSFLQAMTSVGTVPESGALDLALYDSYNAFNTMVGAGGQYMVNKRLTLGLLGNWYNFKFNPKEYSNLYNLYLTATYSL